MQKSIVGVIARKELIINHELLRAIGIVFFLILTITGAFIYLPLPFTPVPITLQTFCVLLSAAFLKKNDGILSQVIYIGLGAIGLPVFSLAQGGLAKLFGPTGGYILGFVFSAFVLARALEYYRVKTELSFFRVLTAMSLSVAVIYLCGGIWLSFFMKYSFSQVVMLGVMPFIPGETIKVAAAAAIYAKSNSRARYLFQ
ncbi:MAG: biotin transporter BioY [Candidatus Omnitrophica bacterium]|nr:biotin transporter BioY [Candidatus Omnitrophota bacterium]